MNKRDKEIYNFLKADKNSSDINLFYKKERIPVSIDKFRSIDISTFSEDKHIFEITVTLLSASGPTTNSLIEDYFKDKSDKMYFKINDKKIFLDLKKTLVFGKYNLYTDPDYKEIKIEEQIISRFKLLDIK